MNSTTTVPSTTRAETRLKTTHNVDYSIIVIVVLLTLLGMFVFVCILWLLFIYFRKKSKIVYDCVFGILYSNRSGPDNWFFKRSKFRKFQNSIVVDTDNSSPNLISSLISKLDFFIKSKTTSFFNILTSRTSNCVVCTFQLPSLLKHPLTFILFYFIWGDA